MKYCLRGFLGQEQRESLFFFLDVMARVLREAHVKSDLRQLNEDVNTALSCLKRNFPISTRVSTVIFVGLHIIYSVTVFIFSGMSSRPIECHACILESCSKYLRISSVPNSLS